MPVVGHLSFSSLSPLNKKTPLAHQRRTEPSIKNQLTKFKHHMAFFSYLVDLSLLTWCPPARRLMCCFCGAQSLVLNRVVDKAWRQLRVWCANVFPYPGPQNLAGRRFFFFFVVARLEMPCPWILRRRYYWMIGFRQRHHGGPRPPKSAPNALCLPACASPAEWKQSHLGVTCRKPLSLFLLTLLMQSAVTLCRRHRPVPAAFAAQVKAGWWV